jgi:hypothetical protein
MTQLIADGADVNHPFPEMNGWTGNRRLVRSLLTLIRSHLTLIRSLLTLVRSLLTLIRSLLTLMSTIRSQI